MQSTKPVKPSPDFPLFAHAKGLWAKKIHGRTRYFGRWDDPAGALKAYQAFMAGEASSLRKPGVLKPYPDFPLTAHPTGRWCKKIGKSFHYFGPLDDPNGALALWNQQKADLLAGRKPKPAGQEITVEAVCNQFMQSRKSRMKAGLLSAWSLADYHATAARVAKAFGRHRLVEDLCPADFAALLAQLRTTWGPARVGVEIQRIRSLFRFGMETIDGCPIIRFGPEFRRADKRTFRALRAEKDRVFDARQLRTIIDAASVQLKAMILLGVNAGFGNADLGTLPLTALDLKGGWVTYPRPKTGVPRRGKLWPETVAALKAWLKARRDPVNDEHAGLVFVTKFGRPWHREPGDVSPDKPRPSMKAPLSAAMRRLLKSLKLYRPGLSFYTLRHVFETVGGESRDQIAVNHVMGHADASMAGVYRERISDERLAAVAETVRKWLFAKK